ncbi:MAG: hypothetical protein NW214_08540 [Pseudanabaenaceae cyanobacterium bins.39]|nr:hypothetical protein [Pseudanabaenaceae cyanobacterium bins.39]
MENWEFLLQRKGDKSWLPLESPTVEILEGQYRLAARTDQGNISVGIAIAYQPMIDVRHEPLQQKIVKRVSHDGLLIVMPYTSFAPGLWKIECLLGNSPQINKSINFDVVPISLDAGNDWQYFQLDESSDPATTDDEDNYGTANLSNNLLGISESEVIPQQMPPISPILEIAEQQSTELVQSMFDEFTLFEDEDEDNLDLEEMEDDEPDVPITNNHQDVLDFTPPEPSIEVAQNQPRSLLRLQQLQYLVNEDNQFVLAGEAYTQGEIEVILKNPQNLDIVIRDVFGLQGLPVNANGSITFTHTIQVPEPDQLQVLIGEIQIHPQQDFKKYDELFIMQQAIAVSYPASRVLAAMLKAAKQADSNADSNSVTETIPSQPLQQPIEINTVPTVTEPAPVKPPLTLPPLPTNRQSLQELPEQGRSQLNISLPPLPSPPRPETITSTDIALQDLEAEFAQTNFIEDINIADKSLDVTEEVELPKSTVSEEPELVYMFEEEISESTASIILPQPFQSKLSQPRPNQERDRHNRFLNKLQTLSSEAIAAQKASQRTEELLLDTFPPSDPLLSSEALTDSSNSVIDNLTSLSIDQDNPEQVARTIAEANTLAELDLELDAEFDRLLTPHPDRILNEYVWEDPVDPNLFPVAGTTPNTKQDLSPPIISEQEPIPMPEILIPDGEIVSGTPMQILLRLPAVTGRFFVKFWIKDLQTRTIIDGPRWLLDFQLVPNTELMETRTHISIPLSSVDVAFEAITMESQTQRESHKARLTRAVTPPNFATDLEIDP